MPHFWPTQLPEVELVEVVEVGMGLVDVLLRVEEKMVVGVVEVEVEEEDLVVDWVEEREGVVDLMLVVEDFTVESDDEGGTLDLVLESDEEERTLDLVEGSVAVGDVELLAGSDEVAAEDRDERTAVAVAGATAVGTASAVNLSAVMPQQEQAEE